MQPEPTPLWFIVAIGLVGLLWVIRDWNAPDVVHDEDELYDPDPPRPEPAAIDPEQEARTRQV